MDISFENLYLNIEAQVVNSLIPFILPLTRVNTDLSRRNVCYKRTDSLSVISYLHMFCSITSLQPWLGLQLSADR